MGRFENCLLACDVDGTLVADNIIHPRCVRRIADFTAEGGIFALATGRSVGAVSEVLHQVRNIGPSVVTNGSMIYDFSTGKTLYEVCVPPSGRRAVERIFRENSRVGIELHHGAEVLVLRRNREVDDHERYEGLCSVDVDLAAAMAVPWNKALLVTENFAEEDALDALADGQTEFSVLHTTAYLGGSTRHYREILSAGLSKATAVNRLCEMLNIRPGGSFAVGDYFNDFEMLQNADIAAAPLNAPPEIRQIVQCVTAAARDGAVADFIDYLYKTVSP